MASLCKSQQCSIERRGFRQELDSWRYKLIHCVGFESILEGLFGPGLLKDLHLFKDCEPTGVCDWSFDENCLFCCLRREKVKEHLAGLHKPVSESGQENILKQEQAKIIRLERQAEEFLNAVFYKKDSPRVSDPNIPLVAREIMQRMIRQFAAEYTSKNSSTQDSSQPNSTKNQSLQKSSSGQSSPATTQNPVLSKLLMADQDSPLDLTVKKSQSEEDCEQEDGVLDLSTKKSPSSGSTFVSVSPSTSNSIGNGMQSAVKNTRDLNNSTNRTLEKFMVKLCTHHRKQFTHVLNHLCNEESTSGTERTSTSISSSLSNFPNTDAENVCACPEYKSNTSVEQEGKCDYPHQGTKTSVPAGLAQCPVTDDESEDLPINVSAMSEDCSFLSTNQVEEIVENKPLAYNRSSEEKFNCEKNVTRCPKKHDRICKSDSENCTVYQKSLGRVLSSDNQDPAFGINLPKIAGKENSLQTSPITATFNVNESDCKLKLENTFHNVVTNKLGNHLSHCEKSSYEYFQDFRGSSVCKSRFHANMKQSKSRKCKRAPGFRINEYDNQCDVVYVSQPITECQFETQNAVLYSRNTARKSTRRYFLSDECCELSTVRTLVRSSSEEERGSCACLEITNASGIHTAMVSETQSSQEVESLLFLKETGIGENPLKLLPQSEKIAATSLNENGIEPVKKQVIQNVPMEHASGPLIALLSLVHKEKNEHDDRSHIEKSLSSQENEESLNPVIAEYTQIKCIGDCASLTANEKSIPNLETNLSNDFTSSVHLGQKESILALMGTDHKDSLENKNIPSNGDMVLEQYNQCSAKLTVGESLVPLENTCTNTSVETTSVSSVFSMPEIEPLISCSNENASGENVQEMEMSQSVCETSKEEISNENAEVSNAAIKTTLPLENSLSIDFQKATKTEDVYDLIDNCTKTNVSSSELEHECMQERTSPKCNSAVFEKENSKSVQSFKDGIGNPALLTPQKREKFLATSDRRLRSREMQETGKGHVDNAPVVWKDHNLQIKLCELPGTKNIQRLVYIRSKTNACFATDKTLSNTSPNNSICEQSLSNMLTEEHVSKIMFANQYSSSFSLLENMEISVDLSSNKRRIYFPAEKKDCLLNIECVSGKNTHNETVCNSVLKNQNKASSKCTSISFSSTRSKIKSLLARTPTKPKRSALPKYNLRPSFTENDTEQPIKCDKRSEQIIHQSGVFANSIELSNTDSDGSKFVHWYSEEENQERISNFNNKYMSVHQSWIPLEKETHLAQKTKNKSDKLKEIWKTKKRVRKNRSAREAQKCSPVQMLFMNSYKISDICRWFLETTETKSLVIVKKLNTRLPEDLPLPMMPLHRYSPSELYPYTLQAERLKKHLKKFASVLPVRNNQNTQIPLTKLIEKEEPEPCDDSVCEASRNEIQETNDCKLPPVNIKKPTRVRILQKYNSIRGKLRHQTVSVKAGKKEHAINTVASRTSQKGTSNKPVIVPKKSLHLLADSPILKSLGTKESNKRGKKRSKEDSTAKSTRQPRKKRKIEIKPAGLKKHLKSISPAKKKVKNVKKMGRLNKSKLPKKERVKNKTCKSKRLASKRKTKAILSRPKSKRINRSIKKTKQTTLTKAKTISEKVAKHRFRRRSTPRPQKTDTVKTVSKSTAKKCVLSHQPKRNKRSKSNSPAPVKRRSLEVK